MAKKSKGKPASKSQHRRQAAQAKTPKPRQRRLPGTEDAVIREIEDAAEDYIEGRDERQEATRKEVELKGSLIALMHKHHKAHYRRGDLEITLLVEKETVKVRRVSEKQTAAEVEVQRTDGQDGEPFNAPPNDSEAAF